MRLTNFHRLKYNVLSEHDEKLSNIDYISSLRKFSQDSAMKIMYIHKQENKNKEKSVSTFSKPPSIILQSHQILRWMFCLNKFVCLLLFSSAKPSYLPLSCLSFCICLLFDEDEMEEFEILYTIYIHASLNRLSIFKKHY